MRRSLTVLKGIFPIGFLLSGSALSALAQPLPPPVAPPPDRTAAQQTAPVLSPQQLQNLVAPLALYPDPLLSQVLAASTYPLEVIEAQQWLRQAGNLRGQDLIDAAKQQDWDPSVQALVAFPDVLTMLTRDIRWTRALGDAFLNQQADVMSAIQTMRASARSNGRLQSTPQQQVNVEQNPDPQNGDQQAITIEPTDPQVIYPPTYDPAYVWGPSPVGAYPDLYYPDYGFGYYPPAYLDSYFAGYGGFGWGWGFNWYGRGLFVNSRFFDRYGYRNGFSGGFNGYRGFGGGRNQWAHDPSHRQGIPYPNRSVASRFGNGASGYTGRSYNGSGLVQGSGNGYRSFSNAPTQSRPQGFRSFSNVAPQSRPQQSYRGFANPSPQRNYQSFRQAPQQSFRSAPQQSFRAAPQQSFRGGGSPRMSSPQFSGGGGGGVRSGGGGGGVRGGGGGVGARGNGGGGGGHHR